MKNNNYSAKLKTIAKAKKEWWGRCNNSPNFIDDGMMRWTENSKQQGINSI